MATLFIDMLKVPYYKHVMGSSAKQFINVVVVCEHIEQGVKSGKIYAPTKRGFGGKEVDQVGDGYRGRKNPFQNYRTPSQIANINLNSPSPTIKLEPQNFEATSQIGNFLKKNYQRIQEQLPLLSLPLNEMYQ